MTKIPLKWHPLPNYGNGIIKGKALGFAQAIRKAKVAIAAQKIDGLGAGDWNEAVDHCYTAVRELKPSPMKGKP